MYQKLLFVDKALFLQQVGFLFSPHNTFCLAHAKCPLVFFKKCAMPSLDVL